MEEYMRESMRKLALWYTRTFKPIMTHEELEPIMAILGFVGLSPAQANGVGTTWKEYVFSAGGCRKKSSNCSSESLPKPRLPYPRIDGLHIYTYRAFIDAVNFYLEMSDISDLFHIRGMPLYRMQDRNRKWRRMEEDDSVFVYREGTLDQTTHSLYHFNKNNSSTNSNDNSNGNAMIRDKGNNIPTSCLVPLKDIV